MSRSNNTELINPAKRFLEWKSDKKCFQYYDKEKINPDTKEQGVNVEVKLPLKFLVLDTLSTIKGYSDSDQSGFWSNEIRDLKIEPFVVKTKKGECAKGLYDHIMGGRDMTGAKYCQSVYVMMKEGFAKNQITFIANIQIMGSALGQWIEFRKKNKIFEGAIEVLKETVEGTKGKTVYNMPIFKKIPTTPESDEQAKKLDIELQEYLTKYFKQRNTVVETEVIEKATKTEPEFTPLIDTPVNDETINENDDLPF